MCALDQNLPSPPFFQRVFGDLNDFVALPPVHVLRGVKDASSWHDEAGEGAARSSYIRRGRGSVQIKRVE
jgi:hypothetical protein